MKKVVFIALILFMTISFSMSAQQKIGYVDSQVILAQFPPAIKAQSDLDALVQKWTSRRDSLSAQLQQMYQQAQQSAGKMSEDQLKQVQQQLLAKQQEAQSFAQQKFGQPNGEIYTKQEELLGPVRQQILEAIDKVRQEEHFNFVFDKVGDALILYADATYDITYKVLDQLKRGK